jgi:hypothetical protein
MHGTPTHRRFEVQPESVELELPIALLDVVVASRPWVGADTAPDVDERTP